MSSQGEQLVISAYGMRNVLGSYLSICGQLDHMGRVLELLAPYGDTNGATSAAGFYRGNGIKLMRIDARANVEEMISLCEEIGFSAYIAAWSLPTDGGMILEAFLRSDSRNDSTAKPFRDIRKALRNLELLEGSKVIRATASGYDIHSPILNDATLERLAGLLDQANIALKYQGRFVSTKEKKEERRKKFLADSRSKWGGYGFHRSFSEFEFAAMLEQLDISSEGTRIYPAHGLVRGAPIFIIEGLSELDMAQIEKTNIVSPYGVTLVMGPVEGLIHQREAQAWGGAMHFQSTKVNEPPPAETNTEDVDTTTNVPARAADTTNMFDDERSDSGSILETSAEEEEEEADEEEEEGAGEQRQKKRRRQSKGNAGGKKKKSKTTVDLSVSEAVDTAQEETSPRPDPAPRK